MKDALTLLLLSVGAVSAIAVAEPVAEPKKKYAKFQGRFGFCGVAGSACYGKRDADAVAEAEPDARYQGRFGFCGVSGSACARMKRSAEAIADAFSEASPDARYQGRFGFCGVSGSACAKARRSIEHVGELAERSYNEIQAREAKEYQDRFGFCGIAGSACYGKRDPRYQGRFGFCGINGSNCKRDANPEAVANIARAIDEWDPTYLSEVCHEEGGECAAIAKAHAAFKQIKRESETIYHKRAAEDMVAEDMVAEAKRAADESEITNNLDELEAALDEAVSRI